MSDTNDDTRPLAPKAWRRKLQRLYDRYNHPTQPLTYREKKRLGIEIDVLRAAIASYGLLTPRTPLR